jgi:phage FluMu protein Com
MNMYDTKTIHCSECGRFIGEIDYDAMVTLPKCGRCTNLLPGVDVVFHILQTRR